MAVTTPLVWKDDTIVNLGLLVGNQYDPSVITLASGDIIVSWVDPTNNLDDDPSDDLLARRYSFLGDEIGSPFQLNAASLDGKENELVTEALADGTFFVAYTREPSSSAEREKIFFERYAADGSLLANGVAAQGALRYLNPKLDQLNDGKVILTFIGATGIDTTARYRVFDVNTNTFAPTVTFAGTGAFAAAKNPDVAALAGGGFVLLYDYYNQSALVNVGPKFQIRDASGNLVKEAFVVGTRGEHKSFPVAVSALEGGGFVAGYEATQDFIKNNVFVKIYDAGGNQVGAKVSVAVSAANETLQDLIGLKDGGFYTVHHNQNGNQLIGQRYSATGQKIGDANLFTGFDASLGLTEDGRINLVYRGGGDIHHVILDPRDNGLFQGTTGPDRLVGTPAEDSFQGDIGNDTLYGAGGNDTMDGGDDYDVLHGGGGNDLYVLKDITNIDPNKPLSFVYDQVVEQAGGGIDTVEILRDGLTLTSLYTLPAFVENAIVVGVNSLRITGNALDNNLTGNDSINTLTGLDGNDVLSGRLGPDTLIGGNGNDTYILDNTHPIDPMLPTKVAYDVVTELADEGIDTVIVQRVGVFGLSYTLADSVERGFITGAGGFTLSGNGLDNELGGNTANNRINGLGGRDMILGRAGDDTVTGGGSSDTVSGGSGNDMVFGGPGQDQLQGGDGNDVFNFNNALGAANADTILDFNVAEDTIRLHSSVFTALSPGTLGPTAFRIGTAAQDADDRIIYNSANGNLFYDPDGSGSDPRVIFATLSPGLALTNIDFGIV